MVESGVGLLFGSHGLFAHLRRFVDENTVALLAISHHECKLLIISILHVLSRKYCLLLALHRRYHWILGHLGVFDFIFQFICLG